MNSCNTDAVEALLTWTTEDELAFARELWIKAHESGSWRKFDNYTRLLGYRRWDEGVDGELVEMEVRRFGRGSVAAGGLQ